MTFQLEPIPAAIEPGKLVAAAAEGDENAWRELVDRFAPLVQGVARSFRLPRDEVEDVSQTVWLRLVEHLDGLRSRIASARGSLPPRAANASVSYGSPSAACRSTTPSSPSATKTSSLSTRVSCASSATRRYGSPSTVLPTGAACSCVS